VEQFDEYAYWEYQKVNQSSQKENSMLFKTVNNESKRHSFVIKVRPRGFCVLYEVKIRVTKLSSFFKP
jgi:hypothetical protein